MNISSLIVCEYTSLSYLAWHKTVNTISVLSNRNQMNFKSHDIKSFVYSSNEFLSKCCSILWKIDKIAKSLQ